MHEGRKKRVGVLRGGPSHEYDVSLQSGGNVLKHIPDHYDAVDIFISRDGMWHMNGAPRGPEKILPHLDVVWNALHGTYGEDGKVQTILDQFRIPFTGSRALQSSFLLNKNYSKALFQYHGFQTPAHTLVYPAQNTHRNLIEVFQTFPQPSVVKPLSGGSSIALTVAKSFPEFKEGIEYALKYDSVALVEEYVKGVTLSCGVVEASDGKTLFSLVPMVHSGGEYAPNAKDQTNNEDMNARSSVADLSRSEKAGVQRLALDLHRKLGLKHYSIVDLILAPSRGIYILEVNTLPKLASASVFPQALMASGIRMEDFIDHVLLSAIKDAQS